jgi:predicted PurR-regulated permease PerM
MKLDQAPTAQNLVAFAAALAILRFFRSILWPLAAAFVFAVLTFALVGWLVRVFPRAPRWTVLLVASLLVAAVLLAAGGVAFTGMQRLGGEWPLVSVRLDALLAQASTALGLKETLSMEALVARVDLPALAQGLLSSLNDAGSGLILMLLFLSFMLSSKAILERKVRLAFAPTASTRFMAALDRTVQGIEAYVWTQALYGLIIALAAGAVMAAVGLHDVPFWMSVLFMLAYIPMLGVAVGSIAPALFALVQFPTLGPAIVIGVSIQAVAFVAGNLVLPRIVARSVNIDPLASLLALGLWGVLWGAPGAFLALPMTLILMFQFAQYPRLRWIAVFISNDGHPLPESEVKLVSALPRAQSGAP